MKPIEAREAFDGVAGLYAVGRQVLQGMASSGDFARAARDRFWIQPDRLPNPSEFCCDVELAARWTLPEQWELARQAQGNHKNYNPARPMHRRLLEIHLVQGVGDLTLAGKLMNIRGIDYRRYYELTVVRGLSMESALRAMELPWKNAEAVWQEVREWVGAEFVGRRMYRILSQQERDMRISPMDCYFQEPSTGKPAA